MSSGVHCSEVIFMCSSEPQKAATGAGSGIHRRWAKAGGWAFGASKSDLGATQPGSQYLLTLLRECMPHTNIMVHQHYDHDAWRWFGHWSSYLLSACQCGPPLSWLLQYSLIDELNCFWRADQYYSVWVSSQKEWM